MDWQDFDWTDVTPVYEDVTKGKLAAIAYDPDYKEAMAYLRAVMSCSEISERALALTKAIILDNPAHYSVWDYRFEIVKQIGNKVFDYTQVGLVKGHPPQIGEDGEWLNELTLDIPKNYQIWNYRQHLEMPDCAEFYKGEVVAVQFVLDDDAKNFHAWSHLKWAISASLESQFPLKFEPLRDFVDKLINQDVYNNSAWSFRYFLYQTWPGQLSGPAWEAEIDYTKQQIALAPLNESVWSYVRGIYDAFSPNGLEDLRKLALSYPKSPRALELSAELSSFGDEKKNLVAQLCELEEFRAPYYRYKYREER